MDNRSGMNEITSTDCTTNENLTCVRDNHAIPLIAISLTIVGTLILVVNGGVFAILIKVKNVRKNPYLFLVLMLCVSDFTVGLGIIFFGPHYVIPSLYGNKILIVLQVVLMTSGLNLSLLQTFLISLQRYLVICKENWNSCIFKNNRKYYVCGGSSIVVLIFNSVLISPPKRNSNLAHDRLLSYVYHGHYLAHSIYSRFLSLSLVTLTLLFYVVTVCNALKKYKKVNPLDASNSTHLSTIQIQMTQQPATSGHKTNKKIDGNCQGKSNFRSHHNLISSRQKKINSTLYLVGLLIIILVLLTGPFFVTLWYDDTSSKANGLVFCLCVLNSLVNPFIYLWRLSEVRKCLKSQLCCVKH